MNDDDIKLVAEILSEIAPRFWIILENDTEFCVIGGSPLSLKSKLDDKLIPFKWRDRFSTPKWDNY
jgi:hypothetical protein|tara:strand:- start:154 stop:351 length:198 start_codon:yes stop_codon:yes gene_type:complete